MDWEKVKQLTSDGNPFLGIEVKILHDDLGEAVSVWMRGLDLGAREMYSP